MLENVEKKQDEMVGTDTVQSENKVEEKVEITEAAETATEETHEDMETLIEQSIAEAFETTEGDLVTGTVVNVNDSYVFVTLGDKLDAHAEVSEFKDENGNVTVKVGDEITAYVVKKNDVETVISKRYSKANVDKSALKDAFERKIPVTGKVVKIIKGGFQIDVLNARAFCPSSQISLFPLKDQNSVLGQSFDFQIIDYTDKGRNIVVSHRVLAEQEAAEKKASALEQLEIGMVIEGTVTRLTGFGAFIDLGGIEGLAHVSEISWTRIAKPSDALETGQKVQVKIIKLDGEKISLSIKQLTENPVNAAMRELKEDQIVNCRVVKNESFGSFVEIMPGVQGLIPISEMRRGKRVNKPSEVVQVGQLVEAQILRVDVEKKKISLSLKALQPDPWDNIDEFLKEGELVEGTIDGVSEFGTFVKVAEGLTGLMPKSKLAIAKVVHAKENVGDAITVRVINIDEGKKRISLEPSEMPEQPQQQERPQYNERRRNNDNRGEWKRYANENWDNQLDSPFKDL